MAEIGAFLGDNWLSLILIVIGFMLAVVEMYLPGFGFPGISGAILMVVGIVLIADTLLQGLLIALVVVALLCVAFSIAIRAASKGRLSKSKLVLKSVATEALEDNPLAYYMDKEGVAATRLSPVGAGDFEGVRLNILSESQFIEEGERVRVVRVEGKRIYVRKVELQAATGQPD